MSACFYLVTSLENAVRRLQDALRDARDEATESKAENQRLIGLLDAAGIDHRRQSGDISLLRPNPSTSSLHNSPSPADFAIVYGAGTGVQSGGPLSGEQSLDAYSAFYNPSPNSLPPSEYLTQQQNLNSQGSGGSNPHSRHVSLDAQGHSPSQFGIPRPGSAASGTSSHSSAHSFHGVFEGSADMEPSMSGGSGNPPTPGIQMGLGGLNLYGNAMTALTGNDAGSSPWNTSLGGNDSQQQQNQESDLGRSDTVKASDPRHAHRRVHSHVEATSPLPSIPQTQTQQPMDQQQPQQQQQAPHDMFNTLVEDPSSSFEFDPYGAAATGHHSRPGSSASSLFSNEGELGHHFHHHHPQLHQHQSQQQQQQQQQPSTMATDIDEAAYYSSEGDFNDMDYLEGMDSTSGTGMTLVDSLLVPSHPGGGFPGSNGMDMGLSSSPMGSGSPFGNGVFPGGGTMNMLPGGTFAMNMGMDIVGTGGLPGLTGGMGPGMGALGGGAGGSGASAHGSPGSVGGGEGGGGPGGQQVPMSSTLAAIKAQAFGTSRKARTRAKRPGADSAAKVAMEALQARAQGLGLDVDLRVDADSSSGSGGGGGGGANVSRSGATVKRRPKTEDAQKG